MRWWAISAALGLTIAATPALAQVQDGEIYVGDGEVLWFGEAETGDGEATTVTVVYHVDETAPVVHAVESPREAAYRQAYEAKLNAKLAKIRRKEAAQRHKVRVRAAKLDFKEAVVKYKLDVERWELAQRWGWEALGREPFARPVEPSWAQFEPAPPVVEVAAPAPPPVPQRVAPRDPGRLVIDWPNGQRTEIVLD